MCEIEVEIYLYSQVSGSSRLVHIGNQFDLSFHLAAEKFINRNITSFDSI